jgi:hypothetical protein
MLPYKMCCFLVRTQIHTAGRMHLIPQRLSRASPLPHGNRRYEQAINLLTSAVFAFASALQRLRILALTRGVTEQTRSYRVC